MIAIYELGTGNVLRYVTCPRDEYDRNVEEGSSCIEVAGPLHSHARVVDGQILEVPSSPAIRTYGQERIGAYPRVGDQLDAIWKAFAQLDPASLPPDAFAMLQQIQAVKAQYPKQ